MRIGKYEEGFAVTLAERMGYEVSTISDFADAGKAWLKLCPYLRLAHRDRFRFNVFTACGKLIRNGNDPQEIAQVLLDFLEEARDEFSMRSVIDALNIAFNVPPKEINPLKQVERLESWGERILDFDDREAWGTATKTIRNILKKYV
jgi:hypothetical protein